ncbi:uncharacterized protein LOC142336149 isoform X2 [Convolutriloba macropyga]|uniref:uncharacterized protein LOC142336149 isoform X2 n=1 Tax=Convolutriloba macropyga TaxID=536237 RepID=UPI003F528B74
MSRTNTISSISQSRTFTRNHPVSQTWGSNIPDEEDYDEDLFEYDLRGDVAVTRNNSDSKLSGLLQVRRSYKHDSRSSSRNSNRTPMTEYQQKAQKAFGVSPLASPIIAKHERAPEVTGIQLIQPQTASDVRGKTAVGNKHGGIKSELSSRDQERLLKKYLTDIDMSGRNPVAVAKRKDIELVVDTEGLVGYMEELKRRGLIRGTFKTPTFSNSGRVYGEPNMRLSADDTGVNIFNIPPSQRELSYLLKSRENTQLTNNTLHTVREDERSDDLLRIDSKFQNQDAIDLTKALNSESTFMSYGYDDDDQSDPSKPGTQEIKGSTGDLSITDSNNHKEKRWSWSSDRAHSLKERADFQRRRSKTFASFTSFNPTFDREPPLTSVSGLNLTGLSWGGGGGEVPYRLSNVNKNKIESDPNENPLKKYRLIRAERSEQTSPFSKTKQYHHYRRPSNISAANTNQSSERKTSEGSMNGTGARRRSSVAIAEMSSQEDAMRANRELKRKLEEMKSDIRSEANEFGRKMDSEVKQKTKELEKQRRIENARIARQRKIDQDRLRQIAATGLIQKAFHTDKISRKVLTKATKTLQGWFRGVLLRIDLGIAKKQATISFGNFSTFYKHYFILMRKIQKFFQVDQQQFQVNPSMKQLTAYMDQRKEYELSLRRVVGMRKDIVRPPQLEMALNRLGKYPCSQEIQRAVLEAHQPAEDAPYEPYSCFMKFSVSDALDACFYIYVPDNIGLKPHKVRISTWMDPIVNGIEVRKYLRDPRFLPEKKVSYERTLQAVMNMMFEQQLKPVDEMFGPNAFEKIMDRREKARSIKL